MITKSAIRLYAALLMALGTLAVTATPASAQFTPRNLGNPPIGETYHIEASAGFWKPTADMVVSSEQLGIPGDDINFKKDLGLTDQRFGAVRVVLRPAKKHKFRFQYIPIEYLQEANVTRDLAAGDNCFGIIFNGQCYPINLPVKSAITWKAYRFSYEYDFVYRDRWFIGFVADAKYTDVEASLASPGIFEGGRAQAPIPAIGGIFRAYVTRNASITGEITGISLPEKAIEDVKAHYFDVDFYATYNFTRNVGAQLGYRSFDLGYTIDDDIGDFNLRGFYFGVVARY